MKGFEHLLRNTREEQPVTVLDWRAYFEAFKAEHGIPLTHRGRLLFPDGWTYSATDYAGPEWPPPEDERELVKLLLAYAVLRQQAVRAELVDARSRRDGALAASATRAVPLMVRTYYRDPETGTVASRTGPLDMTALEERVRWLESDLEMSNENVRRLRLELRLLDLGPTAPAEVPCESSSTANTTLAPTPASATPSRPGKMPSPTRPR